MRISQIQLTKSKTVGVVSKDGKTRFKKAQIMAVGDIEENEDTEKAYRELSEFIERQFEYEKSLT